ncbi:probable U3 small nucleolar RNA-associated protein 11 [Brienomyrus brachyistius]|uniref:probable U3 small nucleolar RNA-associated protein 11 n=1 Tax=Brienomyrus brachyistius TaxID=42636 RepID=UPI0020B1F60C|nr:probable U3 small nucleolar RNA-associated protein 11 [Brienomyrus brachyistius]
MSSFRKALKSQQRNHKERSQPGFRKHFGILEKKKDYRLRADDYHKKQNTLLALRKKAQRKNPDEFYFNMINSRLQDGVHTKKPKNDDTMTEEQKMMMRTQDIGYVRMKRVAEAKKIERLRSELHLLDAEGKMKNKHTFFVDTKKEVDNFDLATHLDTAPELVSRVFNRPTMETLETKSIQGATNPKQIEKLARQRRHQYKMLAQRMAREKEMFVIEQKIQTRKDLQEKSKKIKVCKETKQTPAIYKFDTKRKR